MAAFYVFAYKVTVFFSNFAKKIANNYDLSIFFCNFVALKCNLTSGMQFIDELNESQRAAVAYNDGPLLVIAGAGSGKTRVLTYKIAYLLTQGVPAGHILALTFTNKAAREMKQRIIRLVGEDVGRYLWMGTFHSICSRILRAEAEHIGFTRDFTIYDAADQKSLVKKIVKELQLDDKIYRPGAVLERISAAKSAFIFPEAYAQNEQFAKIDRLERLYKMPSVYAEYNRRLKEANAMDFDDLLMYTVLLLRNNAEVRERYQQRFWHVLVDEYQDTNHTQYLIVKLLAEPQNHICVVGDDAQSIYSFRGATIENILTFQNGYTGAKLFKLERNYRSTQNIVNAANSGLLGCFQPCHSCIDNIIHTMSGVQLRLACQEIMRRQGHEEPAGRAKITPGFNLPCRYVIHTVGPIVNGPLTGTHEELLASCYRSCLDLAKENSVGSIAFCCISTGVFAFPQQRAAEIAVRTVTEWLAEHPDGVNRVIFNVFKDEDREIYEQLLS